MIAAKLYSPSLLDLTGLHGDGVGGTGIGGLDGEFVVGHLAWLGSGERGTTVPNTRKCVGSISGRVDGDGKTLTDDNRRYIRTCMLPFQTCTQFSGHLVDTLN